MKHIKPRRKSSAKTRALIALFCAVFLAGLVVVLWPQLVGAHLTYQSHVAVSEFFDISNAASTGPDVTFEYVDGPVVSPTPRPYPELYEAMRQYNENIYANGQGQRICPTGPTGHFCGFPVLWELIVSGNGTCS